MCGRFVSSSAPDDLAQYFGAKPAEQLLDDDGAPAETEPNFNVAPTTQVFAVRADEGERRLTTMKWGLVPFWAKDAKIGSRMINARSETAPEKPAFRRAFTKRRCILPADGFYEWQKIEGQKTKQPWFIHRVDGEPLVFAGLYEFWHPKDDDGNDLPDADLLVSCTILTTSANDTMAPVHDRMPVMLPPASWDAWLDPTTDTDSLLPLLVPAPEELLTMHQVSTAVNNVRNKGAELTDPVQRSDES